MIDRINAYLPMLQRSMLFANMDNTQILRLLDAMQAHVVHYANGEVIVRYGDPFTEAGFILEGSVFATYVNTEGSETSLAMLHAGEEMGVEFAWNQIRRSSLFIIARGDCAILHMNLAELHLQPLETALQMRTLKNLVELMTKKNMELYRRVWIYGQRHIRTRLKIYLMSLERNGNHVHLPIKRYDLADYLGVERSALSRELSRMARDGLIRVNRRDIELLDEAYFSMDDRDAERASGKAAR